MSIMTSPAGPNPAADLCAGRYLIVRLGREEFVISVLQVKEIIKMPAITSVSQTPAFLQGVVNLRTRFDMPHQPDTERTCIVVVRVRMATGE